MGEENGQLDSLTVLHLEDNVHDAALVAAELKSEWPGCVIRRVDTRTDFESAVRQGGFDLILSDFSLPGYDGLSALMLAREYDTATPFIFLSGTIGEDNAVVALQRGATDYVIKDRMGRLIPAIRRALEEVKDRRKRRIAEEGLRESQERFLQLAEQSSDIFWFVSVDPEQVLYVSPAFETIWGQPVEALFQDPHAWEEAIHPGDRSRVRLAHEQCFSGEREQFEEEYRVVRPDGSIRWILDSGTAIRDAGGRIIRVSGIAKDITDRRLAANQIKEQAALLDKAHDAIVVSDMSRRIVFWNKGAEQILGWSADDAMGCTAVELFGEGALGEIEKARDDLFGGSDDWSGEVQLKNRGGAELTLDTRVTLIRDEAGLPQSILIIGTDVTKRKQLEKQLLRTQRLESIGTLAGGIAHDLNNVLAPILMSINLLQQRVKDPELAHYLGVLETSAQHGAGLVRQVLAFARGVEGDRVNIRPDLVARDVVKLLGETLPRTISIVTDVPKNLRLVSSNSTELSQVLMNLCVNARDAMPDGGRLMIRGYNEEVDEALAAANPGAKPGAHVVLSVSDTGTGIPREHLDRIFDPFFSTKALGKGTGLGLSTVMGIVRSHGGFLQVHSEADNGAEFRVYFPAAAGEEVEQEVREDKVEEPPQGAGESILVIDDEEGVRLVAEGLLDVYGYKAILAADGEEGVAAFHENRADIRAVMVDMMMPGKQGPEVIREIRAVRPEIPVVLMSGFADAQTAEELKDCGEIIRLQKPMAGDEFIAAVKAAVSSY